MFAERVLVSLWWHFAAFILNFLKSLLFRVKHIQRLVFLVSLYLILTTEVEHILLLWVVTLNWYSLQCVVCDQGLNFRNLQLIQDHFRWKEEVVKS